MDLPNTSTAVRGNTSTSEYVDILLQAGAVGVNPLCLHRFDELSWLVVSLT